MCSSDLSSLLLCVPLPPSSAIMGLFSNTIFLAAGVATGMWLAQNYNVPDMNALLDSTKRKVKALEQTSRKADDESERLRRQREEDERSWRRDR